MFLLSKLYYKLTEHKYIKRTHQFESLQKKKNASMTLQKVLWIFKLNINIVYGWWFCWIIIGTVLYSLKSGQPLYVGGRIYSLSPLSDNESMDMRLNHAQSDPHACSLAFGGIDTKVCWVSYWLFQAETAESRVW